MVFDIVATAAAWATAAHILLFEWWVIAGVLLAAGGYCFYLAVCVARG